MGSSLQNQVSGFSKSFSLVKSSLLAAVIFQNFIGLKIGSGFCSKNFVSNLLRFPKLATWFLLRFWQASGFILQSPFFLACVSFLQSQVFKIGFKVFRKSFGKFGLGFFARFAFSGKVNFSQSQFLAKVLASPRLWRFGK